MKIKKITAREISMRLKAPFETSFGVTHNRRIVLIELETEDSVGWGELTAAEGPFYNSETTDTAWTVMREFLAPLVAGKSFAMPSEMVAAMAPVRGHEMAKAALECAAWDASARAQNAPLGRLLGGTLTELPSGVSLGIHEDIGALIDRIALELSSGYRRVKLKIKPGKDVAVVEAVRRAYPEIDLTVDANSAYTLQDAHLLKQLDEFSLAYIEQPLAWNEIFEHVQLQRELKTAICLDECIHSLRDAAAAIQLGACRVINIKLGRVSGHTEARKIQAYCKENCIPVWCGGMLESGVGRAHNIAMSTLPGFVFPGDVSASARYWWEDIIEPEVTVTDRGTILPPDGPGIGFRVRTELLDGITKRKEEWGKI